MDCGRPCAACFCHCVRPVDNLTALLILQHPDEVSQAKGTAALLHRCLRRSRTVIGERFDAPLATDGLVLLYPAATPSPPLVPPAPGRDRRPLTLVVLDGTWRKSRRMLHENPWLQSLPRLSLIAPPPSRYAIRQAQAPLQRSTLEACALALTQLDADADRYQPLWSAMDDFMALHQQWTGFHRTPSAHRERHSG
ncbi:DTW domain-containing protein [Roseateles amylovorans]|uniref:tRNA-uridine aminocarboxypropyltransferase n=1 Tax=Roseateles amylovorans TaxID=2978473 RepID=A0ABY6B7G3_9BURK|nr:tRNA-uridine aminocarboxypropyltransferase [Roseateles amylovorans]UXH80777.1 DTW domain-containing protein [Roseateles amylovorans]